MVHAYHLIPTGASKARAVARHMQARGYTRADCVAVGDSREDMDAAAVVGTFWLVANALERDPDLASEIAGRQSVRVTSESLRRRCVRGGCDYAGDGAVSGSAGSVSGYASIGSLTRSTSFASPTAHPRRSTS